jgi:hypothetical protein
MEQTYKINLATNEVQVIQIDQAIQEIGGFERSQYETVRQNMRNGDVYQTLAHKYLYVRPKHYRGSGVGTEI